MGDWLRRARTMCAMGAATLLCAALPWTTIAATASCETQDCQPTSVEYGCKSAAVSPDDPCCKQGHMLVTDTLIQWESTPQDAPWVSFPADGKLSLYLGAWTNATPDTARSVIDVAAAPPNGPINPDPDADPPDATVGDWAAAAGSLAEFDEAKPGFVEITNGTCTPSIARILITFQTPETGLPNRGPCWN
jgi:hypothetical protein